MAAHSAKKCSKKCPNIEYPVCAVLPSGRSQQFKNLCFMEIVECVNGKSINYYLLYLL